jgi:hypothetical protein
VKPIGLIAGNGQFPLLFAQATREQGREVIAVAHEGETPPELEFMVREIHWVRLGQLGKIINTFKRAQVTEAVMAGGVTKTKLFSKARPDLKGLALLTKIRHLKDDAVLRIVAAELEAEGITIQPSTIYLPDLLTKKGYHTRRRPSKQEEVDIRFGIEMAKEIGRLDIGQTVVVRKGVVVALEAMEGTNECILRGGRLAVKNAVVVKMSKPGQDLRFDVPAVGLETVETMIQVQAGILAVEAEKTLFFNFQKSITLAGKHKMIVVGV